MSALLKLSYLKDTPTFEVLLSGVSDVQYTIAYQTKKDGETVLEALQHTGSTKNGTYTATHLAGTKSGDDVTYHPVSGGDFSLKGISEEGAPIDQAWTFTITAQGELVLEEVGQVLGASEDQDTTQLAQVALPATTAYAQTPTNLTLDTYASATPSQGTPLWLYFLPVVGIAVALSIAVTLKFSSRLANRNAGSPSISKLKL